MARPPDPLLKADDDAARSEADVTPTSPLRRLAREPVVLLGALVLVAIVAIGAAAPWLTPFDPAQIAPASRNLVTAATETVRADDGSQHVVRHWMGTDSLGRDVASRVFYGVRVSLFVGLAVSAIAIAIGVAVGVVAGYFRRLDNPIMRVMDGLMAIPAILLAIALVSVSTAGVAAVIVAIVVPEVPRVVRLVRAVVLAVRQEPYVEAAIAAGTPTPALITRHILPATWSPLIVQATYICATAILVEAILSFLGVGIPPQTPTWGNIMAEGRTLFRVYPHGVLWAGLFVALTVLAINLVGDALRDTLDPRARRNL
ncbi:MAG TPA: ABC transporter permease [Casimicrobiaceae bacterium]|nr:ABC transporter permease [Casimicrobiaceae bacterium]